MVLKVFLPLVILAVAFFAVFAFLTSRGPLQVDCGAIDPTVCEQAWREVATHEEGFSSFIPVTRVRVTADSPDEPVECLDVTIERFIFTTTVTNDCP